MDKTVYAAKVDEYAVACDILDSTLKNLTLLKVTDNFLLLCLKLCLDKSLVRNNDILELLVDLNNLEFHCLANEDIVVADWLNVNL